MADINRGWLIDNLLQHSSITDAGEAASVVETVIRANPAARETELLRLAVEHANGTAGAPTVTPPVAAVLTPVAVPATPSAPSAAPAAFPVTKPSKKKAWYARKWVWAVAAVVIIAGIAGAAGGSKSDDSKNAADTGTTTTAKSTPTPKATKSPDELAAAAFAKAVDYKASDSKFSYHHTGGAITVAWQIHENVTQGLTKDSSRLDVGKLLKAAQKISVHYTELKLIGRYTLVDQLGNESVDDVMTLLYSKGRVDEIHVDNVDFKTLPDLADEGEVILPAFQY